jgi:predicted acyltransferase
MKQLPLEPRVDPSQPAPSSRRIVSIDALRGFDMIWIVGGQQIIQSILQFCKPAVRASLTLPLSEHAEWDGFTFYDLIFPLFIFLVGISTVFPLSRLLTEQGKGAAYRRLVRRSAILFLLGVFYYGGFAKHWPDIRLLGVLQRIALCYLFAGIIFIHFRVRGIVLALVMLLAGYWALLSFVPVPGVGKVSFAPGENWPNYIDAHCLIGQKYNQTWDPEGLLSTLPAIGTCLIGVLVGLLMRNQNVSNRAKVGYLIGGGLIGLLLGYGWGGQLSAAIGNALGHQASVEPTWGWYPFPVIKQIWTSSYVLVAGGYSCILLGLFYTVIDIWKLQRWTMPFVWIGANAIAFYMAWNIIDFGKVARRLVGGDVQTALQWAMAKAGQPAWGEPAGKLMLAAVALGLVLLLARFLYRRKIFLRV